MSFGGSTYSPTLDKKRLTSQLQRVKETMDDGGWWTLAQLVEQLRLRWGLRASEAGVSARIRDLRKPAFGGYVIEHRRVMNSAQWEYRMVPPEGQASLL